MPLPPDASAPSSMSLEAEQAVLGSMLIDTSCVAPMLSALSAEDFALEANRSMFLAFRSLALENLPADPITVAERMNADCQQRAYIAQLMEITPTSANAAEYAAIVRQKAERRALERTLLQARSSLEEGIDTASVSETLTTALANQAEGRTGALLTPTQQAERFLSRRDRVDSGEAPYVRTGFKRLDKLLGGGFLNSGLYILAARPAIGKTSLALYLAECAAKLAGAVVFVSLEMDDEQLTAKRISGRTGLSYETVLNQALTEEECVKVARAAAEIGQSPIYVSAGAAATVDQISAMARSQRDCKLLVVDHFGLIQTPGKGTRYEEYTQVSGSLKRLARSLRIPVLCLAQLNRANEQRANKRPQLSDLRDTGAAEQDADGVLLLHREDYYNPDLQRKEWEPSQMEVILAKNRHGRTGRDDLDFYMHTNRFRERGVL